MVLRDKPVIQMSKKEFQTIHDFLNILMDGTLCHATFDELLDDFPTRIENCKNTEGYFYTVEIID